jgi:hypothetical protein
MIRYVEERIGEGWNTLKYEGDDTVDARCEFFWKERGSCWSKKNHYCLIISVFELVDTFFELL